ncbi:E3 ubiquitin-protein ligase TRIM39-like [Corapipo altera]|uniref:E3 ubiquitin-protein ligase TRIM39-like n=1 Tax=Corapipo altera TaxID=415028 RepID=UPI000FD690E3|nr:E3 ubiquitin-protein ligase TRIM39-like [Corapipo altera]
MQFPRGWMGKGRGICVLGNPRMGEIRGGALGAFPTSATQGSRDLGILGFEDSGIQGLGNSGIHGFPGFSSCFPAVPVAWNALERILELPSGEGDASAPTFPVRVGREGFGSGKHYWELELGREQDWALGVLRENAGCEARPIPSQDSWALRRSQGELFSSAGARGLGKLRWSGSALGVFLDLDWECLEFYDVETAELLERLGLSTTGNSQGMFFPFVSQGEGIRIRPVPIPVPLKGL